MTDADLVTGFEQGTLPPDAFHHREHLRLTWLYLTRYGRGETERRLLAGLQAFAARAGRPEKFDALLTRAWIAAIDRARLAAGGDTFDDLVRAHPELLDRTTRPAAAPDRGPAPVT